MVSWVILAIAAVVLAAWAGFAVHVAGLVLLAALVATYLEPRKSEQEEASTTDS